MLPSTATRVPGSTAEEVNREIEQRTIEKLRLLAECPQMIDERLRELDAEWDIERMLEANASALILIGLAKSRQSWAWLLVPVVVAGFLLMHALQGWCPPLPVFRRLGIRTRREIDNERTVLKLLRGDFDEMIGDNRPDIAEMLQTVKLPEHEE